MTRKITSSGRLRYYHRRLTLFHHKVLSRISSIHVTFNLEQILRTVSAIALAIIAGILIVHRFSGLNTAKQSSTTPVSPIPLFSGTPPPQITAKNYFVLDANSQLVILKKSADAHIYPASTTKMMTALVVIDHFPLDQVITIKSAYKEGQTLGFLPGEKVTVEKLLYALLVYSANDAAEILAENYPGGRSAFVVAMNQKAADLRLSNTHFSNPSGLDQDNHYSSAADLVRLASHLMSNPELARIVSTENAIISSTDYSSSYTVTNVNALLGKVEGVLGVKTGYTDGAGQALVTLVSRQNHSVFLSVMGSQDRFEDTKRLIEWVYSNYHWETSTSSGMNLQPTHTP